MNEDNDRSLPAPPIRSLRGLTEADPYLRELANFQAIAEHNLFSAPVREVVAKYPLSDEPQDGREIEESLRASLLHMLEDVRGQLDDVASAEGASPDVRKMAQEGLQTLAVVRDNCTNGRLDAGKAASAAQGLLALSARAIALSSAIGNGAAKAATPAERVAAAREVIAGVAADYYDNKVLDPYLRFASQADEEAYRRRERANKEAIERELAKGTPEGARNAQRIMDRQLDDAAAHGAAGTDALDDLRKRNAEAGEQLRVAARDTTAPQPTAASTKAATSSELDDVAAALRASGVTTKDDRQAGVDHGLAAHAAVRSVETGRT